MANKRVSSKQRKHLPLAEAMAVQQGRSDEEIKAVLGDAVSLRTLARWRDEYNWNERHDDIVTGSGFVAEKMRKLLKNTVNSWDEESQVIDGKMADQFAKIVNGIRSIEGQYEVLPTAQIILDDLVHYLTAEAQDTAAYEALIPHMVEFTQYLRRKYGE